MLVSPLETAVAAAAAAAATEPAWGTTNANAAAAVQGGGEGVSPREGGCRPPPSGAEGSGVAAIAAR